MDSFDICCKISSLKKSLNESNSFIDVGIIFSPINSIFYFLYINLKNDTKNTKKGFF